MTDIVIVVPPFMSVEAPSTAAGLLVAGCRRLGLDAAAYHANLEMAALTGLGPYRHLGSYYMVRTLAGEAIFAPHAFPGRNPSLRVVSEAISSIAAPDPGVLRSSFRRGQKASAGFLDTAVAAILARAPRIVGFTTIFAQSLAAVALARRLKAADPGILTVLGGIAATPPLGPALAEAAGCIDLVFSGEADLAFPEFCRDYLAGRRAPPGSGLIECGALANLDAVETPDYDDYFADLAPLVAAGRLPSGLPSLLYFESSRGCWWGERHHCLFCSFRDETQRFRSKPAARVNEELRFHAARHGVRRFHATDSIMPREFLRDLLPALAGQGAPFEIFYEVKANLRPDEVALLARAGVVSIQPGIESFSTPLLETLRKGVTGPQNIRLLRECRRRRIETSWNILHGIPGETAAPYRALARLLPALHHLQPPMSYGCLRLDRWSPYLAEAKSLGLKGIRIPGIFRHLFPPDARLEDLVLSYDHEHRSGFHRDRKAMVAFEKAVEAWKAAWRDGTPPVLASRTLADGRVFVHDTRRCARRPDWLGDAGHAKILERLEKPCPAARRGELDKRRLDELLDRRFVIEHEEKLLAIVTPF